MADDFRYIDQVLSGKHQAFRYLVDKYQDYAFTLAFRVLKNREDAEEAAQDAFVKAFRELARFQKTAKFSTWFYKIVYHTAIDYSRKKKRQIVSLDNEDYHFDFEDSIYRTQWQKTCDEDRKKFISKAINRLNENDAAVITLFYLHENSIEEISEITNLSASNVKVKLFRSRIKLKKHLESILHKETKELL
ncbi:MAG: sigma-70 family RNA polymerase sigma factor [Bacteroidota bacterium]